MSKTTEIYRKLVKLHESKDILSNTNNKLYCLEYSDIDYNKININIENDFESELREFLLQNIELKISQYEKDLNLLKNGK